MEAGCPLLARDMLIGMTMSYLIIVAADEGRLFRRLRGASGPGVQVILDRRHRDRRSATWPVTVDRRRWHRRTPERAGWKVRTVTAVSGMPSRPDGRRSGQPSNQLH